MASLIHCFHLGQIHSVPERAGPTSCLPPDPHCSRHSQQPVWHLGLPPLSCVFIVTGPQGHNSSFAFLPLALTSTSAFVPVPASSLSSPLTSIFVNVNTKLLGLLFRSHHQFSQTLSFLQSRPSRFLLFLTTSPFFWIRGKSSPVHLQNSWVYSLLPLTHPQSQLPQPVSKTQPVCILLLPLQKSLP